MEAVVSGSAGLALIFDQGQSFLLRADLPDEAQSCEAAPAWQLLRERRDLNFVEDSSLNEVRRHLIELCHADTALHLSLILLDPELINEVKADAARELDSFLKSKAVLRTLRNVFFGAPLPAATNIAAALTLCAEVQATNCERLLRDITLGQAHISDASAAWDRLPARLFDGDDDREYSRTIAARSGLFRRYVEARAANGTVDASGLVAIALADPSMRRLRNCRAMTQAWVGLLVQGPSPGQHADQRKTLREKVAYSRRSAVVNDDKKQMVHRPSQPLHLFVSYAHQNEKQKLVLDIHLMKLRQEGLIDWWDDNRIHPGQEWDEEIRRQLERADVFVFLVSHSFLASDHIQKKEVPRAIERANAGEAVIIPILLDHCANGQEPWANYQGLPAGFLNHPTNTDDFNFVLRQTVARVQASRPDGHKPAT